MLLIFLFYFRILRFIVVVEQIRIFILITVLSIVVTRSLVISFVVITACCSRPRPWHLSMRSRTQQTFLVATLDLRCLHNTRLAGRVLLISSWPGITWIVRVVIAFRLHIKDWIFTDYSIELRATAFVLGVKSLWRKSADACSLIALIRGHRSHWHVRRSVATNRGIAGIWRVIWHRSTVIGVHHSRPVAWDAIFSDGILHRTSIWTLCH